MLYTAFFMFEHCKFRRKLLAVMRGKADLEPVIDAVNAKIGAYLALKGLLGVVQGILSYVCMRLVHLEFAAQLAVLVALCAVRGLADIGRVADLAGGASIRPME
jgi:AI-2 transport protein TqsA